ncbi:MAG: stage III sporulation protein AF [Ruminococcus sp.]|nr:stage III sporulation protein AF [Ruminococcus sp.]
METMQTIVLVTCVISLLSGILDALKPNRKFDRQMRLLLSAVFLLAILAPLTGGLDALQWDWDTDAAVSEDLTSEMKKQTLEYAQENLAQSLQSYLQENGIADASVQVEMHMTDDACIEINRVMVSCTNPETALALLTECFGEEVRIDVENAS